MFDSKKLPWVVCVVCAVVALCQTSRIETLQFETRLLRDAARIDESQIQELMWMADNANRSLEGEKTRSFLAGVTQAQLDPQYSEIWHSGYDRGTQVAAESQKSDNELVQAE